MKVLYFTRSGVSEELANAIASRINGQTVAITDQMNWRGIWGYLKAGYYSSSHKRVPYKTTSEVDPNDDIVLVAPLWASGLPPACLKFIDDFSKDKIHLVVTSLGSELKDHSGFKSYHPYVKKLANRESLLDQLEGLLK